MILYEILRPIACFLFFIAFSIKVKGKENIPKSGKFIFVSNHISALDPVLIGILCSKREINFMAKAELFKGKMSSWFFNSLGCIKVNRDGNDLISMKSALKILKNDGVIGIFPEGKRNKKGTDLLEFKGGVSLIAIKTKTPLVPVYISGKYKFRGVLNISFGEPFELSEYYNNKKLESEDYLSIANNEIKERIVYLKGEENA